MIIGADTPIGQSFELTTRIKAVQPKLSASLHRATLLMRCGRPRPVPMPLCSNHTASVIFSLLCRHLLWKTRGGEVKKVDERLPERVTLLLPVGRFHCGGARVRG